MIAATTRSIDRPVTAPVPSGIEAGTDPGIELAPVRSRRAARLIVGLGAGVLVAAAVSACLGQVYVPPGEVLGSIADKVGLDIGFLPSHINGENALWNIRFPRLVMGLLVGAALGAAGAVMQGVFGNPLAEPGVIGISSGAAVGACSVIVFGWTFLGPFTLPAAAFLTAVVTTLLVYGLSRKDGKTDVVTLVLMGVAVNAVCSGIIAFLVFAGDTAAREQIVFWQLGSFNGVRWDVVRIAAPLIGIGLVGVLSISHKLDLLALGERAARHLGLDVERLRMVAVLLVALLVATAAFVGIVAFIGLVVPHVIRMAIGPSHRHLVPAAALGGAITVMIADVIARTALEFADRPIGMLTSLVGGPFFFWLLLRTRNQAGGWA